MASARAEISGRAGTSAPTGAGRSRGAGPGRDPLGERAAVVSRLFDSVLRSARTQLLRTDSPLAAEVWASGLMAVWDGLGGPAGGGTRVAGADAAASFSEALVRHARDLGTPEAVAVLAALAAVAPARLAARAATAGASLRRRGVPVPVWVGQVGTAEANGAWVGSDVYGDQEIVIVGFGYPGPGSGSPTCSAPSAPGHCLCVLIDHNDAGAIRECYVAAPLSVTLARWEAAVEHGIALRPVPIEGAAIRLSDALAATAPGERRGGYADAGAPARAGAPAAGPCPDELRALLGARLARLGAGNPPAAAAAPFEAADRHRLVAEFLAAPEAAGLLSEPGAVSVCHSLIAYRCDRGDGDPLRWSPTLAGRCLLDHFPVHVEMEHCDIALVPDVLAAWVAFAGRRRALPAAALRRTLDAIEACRSDFPVAMCG